MRVRDLMTPDPITVTPTDSLETAMSYMVSKRIRELPVLEDGVLTGILTERDVKMALGPDARRMDLEAIDPRQLDGAVDWFMTPGVETIIDTATLGEATAKLVDLRIGALPVVDEDGGLVGILSVTDVLKEAARLFD